MKTQLIGGRSAVIWQTIGFRLLLYGLGGLGSAMAQVNFTPITKGPLVEDPGFYNGCAWADYDNDGFVDVILAQRRQGSHAQLYHNEGDGTFERVENSELVAHAIYPNGQTWVDFDNDGDLDLFAGTTLGNPNAFFRNEGGGEFTKVIEGAWVNTPSFSDLSTWGDYDNDGFVDLYVANDLEVNLFYRNNGDGTMTPLTTAANESNGPSHGAAWSDYDGDGDVDLFVGGQDRTLFRNDGEGVFTWVPPSEGGIRGTEDDADAGFATADYDNDGDLDLLWGTKGGASFYQNEGAGRYMALSAALPSPPATFPFGLAWGDYDNDGHLDLYISSWGGERNLLYHNEGDGTFSQATDTPLTSEETYSAGCSWIDYDSDGDLDLFVANGIRIHSVPRQDTVCDLYRNEGNANHWLSIKLVGTISNRSAVGAKVWVTATIGGDETVQLREISAGGNGQSQSGFRAYFGLGDATAVDALRIEWPSGAVQEGSNVNANQFLTITEEPLIGGIPARDSEDWYRCDWWGEYNTAFAPWLFHAQHGFLYRDPSSTNESMFVYDDALDAWCWTSEAVYPFIHAYDPPTDNAGTDIESEWLWYFEETTAPRVFGVVTGDHAGEALFFGP